MRHLQREKKPLTFQSLQRARYFCIGSRGFGAGEAWWLVSSPQILWIDGSDTVFSWLDALTVNDMVKVVVCLGGGRKVAAICTELVGYRGLAFFAVILVPGRPCIGAYMMGPDCEANGMANLPSVWGSSAPDPGSTTLFSVAGPAVPFKLLISARTLGGKVPVIPVNEKRGE